MAATKKEVVVQESIKRKLMIARQKFPSSKANQDLQAFRKLASQPAS